MGKVSEYRMITDPKPKDFMLQVNEAIQEGWELHGNPFAMSYKSDESCYCQAMIKYVNGKPSNVSVLTSDDKD